MRYGDEAWLDEADWLDIEQDALDELAADTFEEYEDAEYAQDQVPRIGTDEVAARIFAAALRSNGREVRAQVAFGYGPRGLQADPSTAPTPAVRSSDPIRSIVDMRFREGDATVNLEVDRHWRSLDAHRNNHLRAITEAVVHRGTAQPRDARSVLTLMNEDGQIIEVQHISYERGSDGQTVVRVERAFRLNPPLTPEEAWRRGVVRSPEMAAPHGQEIPVQPSLPLRPRIAAVPVQLPLPLRPRRFDAFDLPRENRYRRRCLRCSAPL